MAHSKDDITTATKAWQFCDSMKEYHESITAAQFHDPFREAQEAMKTWQSFHDPMKAYQESIAAAQLHGPLREAQEAMKTWQSFHDPMKAYQESIAAAQLHGPLREASEAMKAWQSFHDPMKAYQESIATAQLHDSLREAQEAMKARQLHDPMKEYREAIATAQFHDPLREAQEAMKAWQSFHDPMKAYQESIAAAQLHGPLREASEAMKAWQSFHDPMKVYQESIATAQLHDSLREAQEAMKARQLHDPMKEYREAISSAQLYDPLREAHEAIKAWRGHDLTINCRDSFAAANNALKSFGMESISGVLLAYDTLANQVVINYACDVTVDSMTFTYEDIQSLANRITDKAFDTSSVRLEQALAAILTEIRGLQSSPLQKAMTWLLFPILVGLVLALVTPVADFYIKESLEARKTENTIRKQVLNAVDDPSHLKPFRLVVGKSINVRSNPSAQSPILGRLHVGQVVRLVEKRKDWCLVVWKDDDLGTIIQGWVFSRYLGKFR